jgi:hypothetical protein
LELDIGFTPLLEHFSGFLQAGHGQQALIALAGCGIKGEGQAHLLHRALDGIKHIAGKRLRRRADRYSQDR